MSALCSQPWAIFAFCVACFFRVRRTLKFGQQPLVASYGYCLYNAHSPKPGSNDTCTSFAASTRKVETKRVFEFVHEKKKGNERKKQTTDKRNIFNSREVKHGTELSRNTGLFVCTFLCVCSIPHLSCICCIRMCNKPTKKVGG